MSHSFIIEVADAAVGILARENPRQSFRFFAADPRVNALEGRSFSQPRQAERVARDLIGRRSTSGLGARL
jgi:hypothetical protein